MQRPITAVLLCAGKGTRMQDTSTHKVCHKVAGVPVILRMIKSLSDAGVNDFLVVVGHQADKVRECLKETPNVRFATQETQRGTADAVLCALKELRKSSIDRSILICMGDKLVDDDIIADLISAHRKEGADVSLLTQNKSFNSSGGRIVTRRGSFYAFLESLDEKRLRLLNLADRTEENLKTAISAFSLNEKKADLLLQIALKDAAEGRRSLPYPLEDVTVEDADAVSEVNCAFYLWEDPATAEKLLSDLPTDNAQGELYLTDAVTIAKREGQKVITRKLNRKNGILSYSTMEELREIENIIAAKTIAVPESVTERIRKFESGEMDELLFTIYGPCADPVERRAIYLAPLYAFYKEYGERDVIISRAPGRVNLMGRHIEHRGGSTNILAIDRESVAVVAPRNDDHIVLKNTDKEFSSQEFSITDIINSYDTDDWVEFIESDKVRDLVAKNRGDWSNYIKSGVLRLQLADRSKPLCGMDMMFSGNIPMAAGLSSSSSLVVATMEAVIALNSLNVEVQDFVALSGEGEWFVGSRGGSGDHAAMKCGKRGRITHMNFFPFSVGESVTWPEKYDIVVANSGIKAKKSDGARDKFNAMVASYELAYLWVCKEFPEYENKLRCLRDINAENLGISEADIYRILLSVPCFVNTDEIYSLYPEKWHERIRRVLASHQNFKRYRLRGVLLYGLSECARANHCIDLLKASNYERLGELMCLSHNGDRVWQNGAPYAAREDDEYLNALIRDLKSHDPEIAEAARLYNQPGVYACSTREIDLLVDYIVSRDGVLGAQLSGAGLGGCVIVLVEHEHTEHLIHSLNQLYYKVRNLPPSANVFTPVEGSQVF